MNPQTTALIDMVLTILATYLLGILFFNIFRDRIQLWAWRFLSLFAISDTACNVAYDLRDLMEEVQHLKNVIDNLESQIGD